MDSDTAPLPRADDVFDYEGRTRIANHAVTLEAEYAAYLDQHPEVQPALHDTLQHILITQPDRPLEEMQRYVRSRRGL